MEKFGFIYSLCEDDNEILRQDVSGTKLGTVLEHIAKTVNGYHNSSLKLLEAKVDGKTIINEQKLESLNVMLQLAVEHYSKFSKNKITVKTLKNKMTEDLEKILKDKNKSDKFVQALRELELPSLDVGDTLLIGKFKNRKAEIKDFATDEHNQPIAITTKGKVPVFKSRVVKLDVPKEDA